MSVEDKSRIIPIWATDQTKTVPRNNFGAEIEGPFEIQLDPNRAIRYEFSHTCNPRNPQFGGPEDNLIETLALEHWEHEHPGLKLPSISEILELAYTYNPDGTIHEKIINIDQINTNLHQAGTYDHAWYDQDGTLHRGSCFTGWRTTAERQQAAAAGHFESDELPEHIDFEATAKAFIELMNQLGQGAPFQKPQLVPAITSKS